MGNMAEARRKMHERDERVKKENKSEVKKIRNFFFGCCNNKESKKVKERQGTQIIFKWIIKHYFLKKDYFYLILFNFLISKKK